MELHVEFFVEDLARSRDFYTRVLGFTITRQKDDGFTELNRGAATLALNSRMILTPDHPARPGPNERIGKGVEISCSSPIWTRSMIRCWPVNGRCLPR
jgi:catechol 2,3-dioxygenase-like lactoylglutathione lyase family enzyme